MKKIIISAIMGLMAVCGMAQETPNTVVITKVGGETIKVAIEDVQDITFAYEAPVPTVDLVDLGLSVKWATCNLGATSPTDAGWYLAWGETSAKTNYTWETYLSDLGGTMTQWQDAGTDKDPLKDYVYGGSHSEGIGATAYDAATVALGAGYRMPTQTEFAELANTDNCAWVWYDEDNTEFNGVAGYKVTSKKAGYTGNSIFLPAAGCRNGESLYYEGSLGVYWSSTPYPGNAVSAYHLDFYSDYVSPDYGSNRYSGFPVRPVSE
ncbi:MAG: hypothetical protein MJZ31_09030 [Bacteroidales bacterium]|nr:hypothetical protein [Bacteroidales bacterium]